MKSGDSRSGQMECQISSHSRSCAPRITWMCTWHSHHHSRVSWVQKVSSHTLKIRQNPLANISIPFVSLYRSAQWSSLHLCATSDWKEAILISHRIFSLWNKTGSEWTVLWKHGKMSACRCFLSSSLVTCWLHDDRPDTIHNAHDEMKKENIYTRNWDTQQTAMRLNR